MTAPISYYPPVLAPSRSDELVGNRHAAGYLQHLRRVRVYLGPPGQPAHVLLLVARTILPALDRINREHIARWQEATEERFK